MRSVPIAVVLLVAIAWMCAPASAQSPTVASVTLDQPVIYFGETVTGAVTLSAPAPAGGLSVDLRSEGPPGAGFLMMPIEPVRVAEGQTTTTFRATARRYKSPEVSPPHSSDVDRDAVRSYTPYAEYYVRIEAIASGTSVRQTAQLRVRQLRLRIAAVSEDETTDPPQLTVSLYADGGLPPQRDQRVEVAIIIPQLPVGTPTAYDSVNFPSTSPGAEHVFPAGQVRTDVRAIYSFPPARPTGSLARISANTDYEWNFFHTIETYLRRRMPWLPASLSLQSTNLFWGQSTTATVAYASPAPDSGRSIGLRVISLAPGAPVTTDVTIPAEVRVPPGQTSATFEVSTRSGPTTDAEYRIQTLFGGQEVGGSDVLRLAPLRITLSVAPNALEGEAPGRLTATMGTTGTGGALIGNRPAPADVVVALSTAEAGIVAMPASIRIPAGQLSASVPIAAARPVTAPREIRIDGTAAGWTSSATLMLQPSRAAANPDPAPSPLSAIAGANFPQPQSLTATLVPPPSPLAPVSEARFPTPQTLAATLVPPPSPLAPVATANFPAPQGLTAILVPGGELASAPAGPVASPTTPAEVIAGGSGYSVQIVQVIPRRGANFFDRNDPTGQSSVLAAQTATGGGSTAATCAAGAGSGAPFQPRPPIGREVCHTLRVFSDPAGLGDVLGLHTAVELELFFTAGANLSTNVQIRNPGITPIGTYTGTNNSTFSISGNLTVPVGTAPAGTPIRASGTKPDAASRPQNFSLHVCLPGGVVEYRQADTQCQ